MSVPVAPWVRVADGALLADTPADFFNAQSIRNFIAYDATGTLIADQTFFFGLDPNDVNTAYRCTSYTSTAGPTAAGSPFTTEHRLFSGISGGCADTDKHL